MKKVTKVIMTKFPILGYKIKYLYYLFLLKSRRRMSIATKKKVLNKKYKKIFHREIDWVNPRAYTEKIQYYKLFESNEINIQKAKLTDKYLVREWITETIGSEYLIPLLGKYDSFSEIDFNTLPKSFVIKCSHDSGSTVLVDDKEKINWKQLKSKFYYLMKVDFSLYTFESHYHYIKPRILVEMDMRTSNEEILDYKFLCFHGKAKYCWVDIDRYENHKRNIYDLEWNLQNWNQNNHGTSEADIKKPEKLDEMIEIAEKLSTGFSHVRVDLYYISGKIYFGEMTFTNGSGFEFFRPDSADYMLGKLW